MRRSDASASGADIERLAQFDKFNPVRIGSAEKNRDLDANSGTLPLMGGRHGVFSLQKFTRHLALFGTVELVRC